MNTLLPEDILNEINFAANECDFKELKSAANILSENYRAKERDGGNFILSPVFSAAYAAARMPATYAACLRAMYLTKEEIENIEITSALDFGSGTGAAALAVSKIFTPKKTVLIERQKDMSDLSRRLLKDENREFVVGDISALSGRKSDIVSAAYVLNEMPDLQAYKKTLKALYDAADKLLIVVDAGTPLISGLLNEGRKYLQSLGAYCVAPCKGEKCALQEGDWCSFSVRLQRSKLQMALKGGQAPYEDEKFSFFAVSKKPVLHRFSRVLRHPDIASKNVTLTLCGDGGIEKRTVTKKQKYAFKAARKAASGDNYIY